VSFDAVEYATLEWADWFNHRRLREPIGNIPPAEAEANFYAALETTPLWKLNPWSHGRVTNESRPPAKPARFKPSDDGLVREDPDDLGAALHFAVEALQRVRAYSFARCCAGKLM
jgi:hypothetical protein